MALRRSGRERVSSTTPDRGRSTRSGPSIRIPPLRDRPSRTGCHPVRPADQPTCAGRLTRLAPLGHSASSTLTRLALTRTSSSADANSEPQGGPAGEVADDNAGTDGAHGRRAVQEDGGSYGCSCRPRVFRWSGGDGAGRKPRLDRDTDSVGRAQDRRGNGRLGGDCHPAGPVGWRRGDRRATPGQRSHRSAARRCSPAGAAGDRRCATQGRVEGDGRR